MTKQEYVLEILSENLEWYKIDEKLLKTTAKDIADGLDMWHEMSGERVADTNYKAAEKREQEERLKAKDKEIERMQLEHNKELQDVQSRARYRENRYQKKIEELQKQVK